MMQHWGNAGLDKHLKGIQGQYRRRARLMHTAAQKVRNHQAAPADIWAALSSVWINLDMWGLGTLKDSQLLSEPALAVLAIL